VPTGQEALGSGARVRRLPRRPILLTPRRAPGCLRTIAAPPLGPFSPLSELRLGVGVGCPTLPAQPARGCLELISFRQTKWSFSRLLTGISLALSRPAQEVWLHADNGSSHAGAARGRVARPTAQSSTPWNAPTPPIDRNNARDIFRVLHRHYCTRGTLTGPDQHTARAQSPSRRERPRTRRRGPEFWTGPEELEREGPSGAKHTGTRSPQLGHGNCGPVLERVLRPPQGRRRLGLGPEIDRPEKNHTQTAVSSEPPSGRCGPAFRPAGLELTPCRKGTRLRGCCPCCRSMQTWAAGPGLGR